MEYLFYYMPKHQTRSEKIKSNEKQQMLVTTQVFFGKTELQQLLINALV